MKNLWKALSFIFQLITVVTFEPVHQRYSIVASDSNSPCLATHTCLTLSQLAADVDRYVVANTSLFFVQGDHTLAIDLLISNINFLKISISDPSTERATVTCLWMSRFEFRSIKKIVINGVRFVGCGCNKVVLARSFIVTNALFLGSGTALQIDSSVASISHCSFVSNFATTFTTQTIIIDGVRYEVDSALAGGAIVVTKSEVVITDTV